MTKHATTWTLLLLTACGDAGSNTTTGADTGSSGAAGTTLGADTSGTTQVDAPTTGGTTSSASATGETGASSTGPIDEPTTGGGSSSTGEPLPAGARRIDFINNCGETVWVGALGNPIAPKTVCGSDADCGENQLCDPGNSLCTWRVPDSDAWELPAGQQFSLVLPASWGGRFWPRTGCAGFNENGMSACETGDCGGHYQCPVGVGGTPPATLAEFTMIPPGEPVGVDFYDVSAVDGANLPVRIEAVAGSFVTDPPPGTNLPYYCQSPGCTQDCGELEPCAWDLDVTCPPELRVLVGGQQVGCRSANQVCAVDPGNAALACAATGDLYGCTEGGPNGVIGSCYSNGAAATCCGCPSWSPPGECNNQNPKWQLPSLPEKYAKVFKDACPTAYSFPYDDPTSTFTCQGTPDKNVDYEISFCP